MLVTELFQFVYCSLLSVRKQVYGLSNLFLIDFNLSILFENSDFTTELIRFMEILTLKYQISYVIGIRQPI